MSLLMLSSALYHKGPIEISGLIAKKVTAQQFTVAKYVTLQTVP